MMSNSKLLMKDLTSQNIDKLDERIVELKKELFNLRFQKALGELKNTSRFLFVKKAIARLKTELTRKKMGI